MCIKKTKDPSVQAVRLDPKVQKTVRNLRESKGTQRSPRHPMKNPYGIQGSLKNTYGTLRNLK